MLDKQLKKLERKYGRFAIKKLMLYIVAGMLMLYVGEIVAESLPNVQGSIFSFLYFDRELILHGQVWRLISFIFIPPNVRPLFVIFELYFCWLFGNSLEEHWGSFRFNVYYLLGTLGAIISGFITGGAS
ncbi:MAG: rhomboid family intramembrane serine protease, partial [Ruminococcus sp.]|nr:rhomboid family intramembrane serine protease [Ruminococcus sp.]